MPSTTMARKHLAGAEGFEPPSPVLETGSLTVELTPLHSSRYAPALLNFLVRLMLTAAGTKLTELQTLRRRLLILRGGVILLFARRALQCNHLAWHYLAS